MLNILFLDQKYISYTMELKRYLPRFLFAPKAFPIQMDGSKIIVEPRSSDLFTIYEIYEDQGYLPKLAQFHGQLDTVVDFGANIGVFSIWVARMFHPKSVFAVEMEPKCFQRLQENIAINQLEETIHPVQAAIFNHTGAIGTKRIAGSPFFELTPNKADHQVKSFSFGDFLDHTGLEQIDLLKIDIEGAEKYLLTEENACLFQKRVKYILLETHTLNNFRTEQAMDYLSQLGFQLALRPTPYVMDHNSIIDAYNPN